MGLLPSGLYVPSAQITPTTHRVARNGPLSRGLIAAVVGLHDFTDAVDVTFAGTANRKLLTDVRGGLLNQGGPNRGAGTGAVVAGMRLASGTATTANGQKYVDRLTGRNEISVMVILSPWVTDTAGRWWGLPFASSTNTPEATFNFGHGGGAGANQSLVASYALTSSTQQVGVNSQATPGPLSWPASFTETGAGRMVQAISLSRAGTAWAWYRDGMPAGTATGSSAVNWVFPATVFDPVWGGDFPTPVDESRADVLATFVWDRALSADEMRLASESWSTTIVVPRASVVLSGAVTAGSASVSVTSPVAVTVTPRAATATASVAVVVAGPVALTVTPQKSHGTPATFSTVVVVGDSISNGYSYATDPVPVQYGAAKLFGITAANWTNADANINPVWHAGSATAPFPNKSAYNASIGGMSALESADHPFTDARATYGGLVDLMIINLGGNDRIDDYTAVRTEQITTFTADAGTDVCTLPAGFDMPNNGDMVIVSSTGTLPAPLLVSTAYYIIRLSATTYKLAATYADAIAGTPVINITSAGTGTHVWQPFIWGGALPGTQLQYFEDCLVAIGCAGGLFPGTPNRGAFSNNLPTPKYVLIVGEWELAGAWGATQFTHAQMLTACQNAVARISASNLVYGAAYVYVGADADQGFRPDGSSLKGVDTAIPGANPDPYNGDGARAFWVHPSDIGNNDVWAPTIRAGINALMGTADAGVVVSTPVTVTVTPQTATPIIAFDGSAAGVATTTGGANNRIDLAVVGDSWCEYFTSNPYGLNSWNGNLIGATYTGAFWPGIGVVQIQDTYNLAGRVRAVMLSRQPVNMWVFVGVNDCNDGGPVDTNFNGWIDDAIAFEDEWPNTNVIWATQEVADNVTISAAKRARLDQISDWIRTRPHHVDLAPIGRSLGSVSASDLHPSVAHATAIAAYITSGTEPGLATTTGAAVGVVAGIVSVASGTTATTGTAVVPATSTSSLAAVYPAGVVAGNQIFMVIGHKPSVAGTPPTLNATDASTLVSGGWSEVGSAFQGGTGAVGVGTGPTYLTVYRKLATAAHTGSIGTGNMDYTGAAGVGAVITSLANTPASTSYVAATESGSDVSVANTTWSATTSGSMTLAVGDLLLIAVTNPNSSSGAAFTSPTLTAAGHTFTLTTTAVGTSSVTSGSRVRTALYRAVVTGVSTPTTLTFAATVPLATQSQGALRIVAFRAGDIYATLGTPVVLTPAAGAASGEATNGANTQSLSPIQLDTQQPSVTVVAGDPGAGIVHAPVALTMTSWAAAGVATGNPDASYSVTSQVSVTVTPRAAVGVALAASFATAVGIGDSLMLGLNLADGDSYVERLFGLSTWSYEAWFTGTDPAAAYPLKQIYNGAFSGRNVIETTAAAYPNAKNTDPVDLLIISMGANDQVDTPPGGITDLAAWFETNLVQLANGGIQPGTPGAGAFTNQFPKAAHVLFVIPWAWRSPAAQHITMAQVRTATHQAAERVRALPQVVQCVVVDVGSDASRAFQLGTSTPGVNRDVCPATGIYTSDGSGIHPSALAVSETWVPAVRAGLNDLFPQLGDSFTEAGFVPVTLTPRAATATASASVSVANPVAVTVTPRAATVTNTATTSVANPVAVTVTPQTATVTNTATTSVANPVTITVTPRAATVTNTATTSVANPVALTVTPQAATGATPASGDAPGAVGSPVTVTLTPQAATATNSASVSVTSPVAITVTPRAATATASVAVGVTNPVAITVTPQAATGATPASGDAPGSVGSPVTVTLTPRAATATNSASVSVTSPVAVTVTPQAAVGSFTGQSAIAVPNPVAITVTPQAATATADVSYTVSSPVAITVTPRAATVTATTSASVTNPVAITVTPLAAGGNDGQMPTFYDITSGRRSSSSVSGRRTDNTVEGRRPSHQV